VRIIKNIKGITKYIYQDHLYRNSFYLILSNVIVGITGFLFWLIAARFYSVSDIGFASALFSVMGVLMLLSLAGINQTFIRFIPNANEKERNKIISTSLFFSILASIFLSVIFIVFIDTFSPKLHFIKQNYIYISIFIISVVASSVFGLLNGLFIAKRKSNFLLIKNTVQGGLKLFPLPFVIFLGTMGIFLSHTLSLIVAILLSSFLFIKIYPNFKVLIDLRTVKKIFAFTFANQIATISFRLPGLLFPIIILNLLSARDAAYFYIPWIIFSMFCEFIILINSAFLMEGSNEEKDMWAHKIKTIKLSFLVVFGGIVLFFVLGETILSLFGKEYVQSLSLLYVLIISSIPFAINQVYLTTKNIKKEVKEFTLMNVFIYSSILIISLILIPYFGTIGVAYGWLIGQMLGIVWIIFKIFLFKSN